MSAFIYFFYTSLQIIYSIIIIIINVEVAVVVIHPHHHFHSHGYSSTSLLLIRNRIVKVCMNKKTIQNQPLLFSVVLIQPKHSVSQPAIRPAIQLKSSLSVAHSFSLQLVSSKIALYFYILLCLMNLLLFVFLYSFLLFYRPPLPSPLILYLLSQLTESMFVCSYVAISQMQLYFIMQMEQHPLFLQMRSLWLLMILQFCM